MSWSDLLNTWFPGFDPAALAREWFGAAVGFLPTLLLILLILLVAMFVAGRSQRVVAGVAERARLPSEMAVLAVRVVRIGVFVLAAMLILDKLQFGTAVTSFVAGLGITSIVVGFALQDIVKQFAAGVLLVVLRPFRVGECIKVNGFEGRVEEIQLRATVLKTVEGDEVFIPNADVYNNALVNKSRYHLHRSVLALHIPRGADLEKVRAGMLKAVAAVPGVVETPAPALVATALDADKISLELRVWINTHQSDPDSVMTAVIGAARAALDKPAAS